MRRLSVLLALLGVAGAAALVLRFDAGDILRAMLAIGWPGAVALLALQGVLFCILGLAWATVQPGIDPALLVWGRMVRDAATTCLPFSPVGGYVLGIRAVTLRGPAWPLAAAGTIVDVTAEITAQLLFALFGVATLLVTRPGTDLVLPLGLGLGTALILLVAGYTQRARIGTVVGMVAIRLLGERAQTVPLGHETQRLYADRGRVAAAIGIHLCGWLATGVATWLSLRLLGQDLPILPILALEAVVDAVVAVAFLVPSAIGVQEAGYVGLGTMFGIPPDLALGVSLLRRAREITWGVPILTLWQWQEFRRL